MKIYALLLLLTFSLNACAAGRPPVPPGQIPPVRAVSIEDEQYGHNVLTTLSQQFELDYDHPRYDEVMEVVEQLTEGISAQAQPWHVHVFKHNEFRNAAATRGNHIFIWTAMIDATKSRGELAAILSHELAHVLAGHTEPDPQEEINKMLIGIGALAAGIAVSAVTPDPTLASNLGQLTSSVTEELGNGLITNPYSRRLELEADQVGLMIMAKSKFDPNEALAFWKRASQDPSFSNHAEFFSTHPIAEQRLEKLQELLPLAMQVYRNPSSLTVGVAQPQQPATRPTGKGFFGCFDGSLYIGGLGVGDVGINFPNGGIVIFEVVAGLGGGQVAVDVVVDVHDNDGRLCKIG